jgi:Bifunctional DNA primase/polymerase, N-terminal
MSTSFNETAIASAQAVLAQHAAQQGQPMWETPAHTEVALATVNPEDLGLDPFSDDPLVRKINLTQEALIAEPGTPYFGALKMREYGAKLIPLLPREKKTTLNKWEQLATNDLIQIGKWHKESPNANWAVVAKAELGGHWMFEIDDNSIIQKIVNETGHRLSEIETFKTNSSPLKGHLYFLHSPESIALGNCQGRNAEGGEAWSARCENRYCVAAFSIHPITQQPYEIRMDKPLSVAPLWLIEWCEKNQTRPSKTEVRTEVGMVPHGSIHPFMVEQAGRLRHAGLEVNEIEPALLRIVHEQCEPPIDDAKVKQTARSMANYPKGTAAEKIVLIGGVDVVTNAFNLQAEQAKDIVEANRIMKEAQKAEEAKTLISAGTFNMVLPQEASLIPAFDDSVITGIFKDIVDLATNGTTIPRQFTFLNAKVYMGALMAGKTTFDGLDCDSSYYGAAIGVTGTSKGESWRRTVEKVLRPDWDLHPSVKIIFGADSGAGLKDAFFEPPQEQPIIDYIDEIISLGHRAGEKKNPEIIDTLIELADSHRISRVLAKRGKQASAKTHENARLSAYICGQDGAAFMSAFAGRSKMGLFNRLYPEFSGEIEAGDLPDIPQKEVIGLMSRIKTLKLDVKMTMSEGIKEQIRQFWERQEGSVKRGLRFKKYLILDMYMAAFGRGVLVAEQEDLDVAIKIFNRQMLIRKVCFTTEIPDRVGFYSGKIKAILELMQAGLNAGKHVGDVAVSIVKFHDMTHAYRDNELSVFNRAWASLQDHIKAVRVKSRNGQDYVKYIPMPNEDEAWMGL